MEHLPGKQFNSPIASVIWYLPCALSASSSLLYPAAPAPARLSTRMHTRAHTHTYVHTCAERLPHAQTPCTQHLSNTQRAHTYAHTDLENTCPMEHTQSCMCTHTAHTDNTRVCTGLHRHAQNMWVHRAHACKAYCHTWGTCRRAAQATLLPPSAPSPLLPCSTHHAELGAARWGSGPYHPHSLSTEGG